MSKITHVLAILQTRNELYHGFRITRCRDGKTVEAQTGWGTVNNILFALRHDGKTWNEETYYYYLTVKERDLFSLPSVGGNAEDIRASVAKEFRKRRKKT